jgi:ubiquinone/menaquinone biosynthesis C-methylase UbiE
MKQYGMILRAFTELAPGYEETMDRELRRFLGHGYGELCRRLVEEAALEDGDWVLDLATGTGLLARYLAKSVGSAGGIIGLDITSAMLDEARGRVTATGLAETIHLICGSGTAMPLGHGRLDAAICAFGAHHMEPGLLLSELGRVLRPGGRLVLTVAGAPARWRVPWAQALLGFCVRLVRLLSKRARFQAEVEALRNVRSSSEWHALLAEAGFSQADVSGSRPRRPWYPRPLTIKAVARGGG